MTAKTTSKTTSLNKNLRDSYKKYLTTTENPVNIKTYVLINSLYNKFLTSKVLEGHEVTLPARLGTLCILGSKSVLKIEEGKVKGLAPDWVSTKKLWDTNPQAKLAKKLLYHTNTHTDGVRYKWHWSKNNVLVENKSLYALRLTRENKRAVHSTILEGKQYKTKI